MNKNIHSPSVIFVFGSNLAGRHGAGAALHARRYFEACYGVGVGPTGRSYGIATKDAQLKTLSLDLIEAGVKTFLRYAGTHQDLTFIVTAIGCGYAGYAPEQVAPFFAKAPENCFLSPRFVLP